MADTTPMSPHERRNHIGADSNPGARLDYVIELKGEVAVAASASKAEVVLRYVPDRQVLQPVTFGRYLGILDGLAFQTAEAAATTIIEDLNNELVTRWIQVTLSLPSTVHAGIQSHRIMLEDRQPDWDNPFLLERLRRF